MGWNKNTFFYFTVFVPSIFLFQNCGEPFKFPEGLQSLKSELDVDKVALNGPSERVTYDNTDLHFFLDSPTLQKMHLMPHHHKSAHEEMRAKVFKDVAVQWEHDFTDGKCSVKKISQDLENMTLVCPKSGLLKVRAIMSVAGKEIKRLEVERQIRPLVDENMLSFRIPDGLGSNKDWNTPETRIIGYVGQVIRFFNDDQSGQIHTLHTDPPDRRPCPHFDTRGVGVPAGSFYDCPLGQSFHPQNPNDELWDHEQGVDNVKVYMKVYSGQEEFQDHCISCHTVDSMRGKSKVDLGRALESVPEMQGPDLMGLDEHEIGAIVYYLNN